MMDIFSRRLSKHSYRCSACREILETYCTDPESAKAFLIGNGWRKQGSEILCVSCLRKKRKEERPDTERPVSRYNARKFRGDLY